MKKIVALVLALVLVFSLSACAGSGKPNGTYVAAGGTLKLEFSQNNFKLTIGDGLPGADVSVGTFEMNGNEVNCSFESGGTDVFTYDAEKDSLDWYGAATFEKVK